MTGPSPLGRCAKTSVRIAKTCSCNSGVVSDELQAPQQTRDVIMRAYIDDDGANVLFTELQLRLDEGKVRSKREMR